MFRGLRPSSVLNCRTRPIPLSWKTPMRADETWAMNHVSSALLRTVRKESAPDSPGHSCRSAFFSTRAFCLRASVSGWTGPGALVRMLLHGLPEDRPAHGLFSPPCCQNGGFMLNMMVLCVRPLRMTGCKRIRSAGAAHHPVSGPALSENGRIDPVQPPNDSPAGPRIGLAATFPKTPYSPGAGDNPFITSSRGGHEQNPSPADH